MPMLKRFAGLLVLAALPPFSSAQDFDDWKSWPGRFDDVEPTPEETLVLVLINEFRADPVGFAQRVRAKWEPLETDYGPGVELDWQMFVDECAELAPSAPLVHELQLARPARSHALYTIANNHWGHEEREGGLYFTGQWPGDRLLAAGVSFSAGENTGTGRPDPWSIVAGLVLDVGPGGTGGMQPSRGHRRSLHGPRGRVAAAGIVRGKELSPFTVYVGRLEGRFLGGVAYVDLNDNGSYDALEGLDGVSVGAKREPLGTSWSSGGYGIRLPDEDARKLLFNYRGLEIDAKFEGGTANVLIDAEFSELLTQACESILRRLEKLMDGEKSVPDKLLFELLHLVRGTPLPQGLEDRLATCVNRLGTRWSEMEQDLEAIKLRALVAIDAADERASKALMKEARSLMRGAPQLAWFELAAELCGSKAKLNKVKGDSERQAQAEEMRAALLPLATEKRLRARVRSLVSN